MKIWILFSVANDHNQPERAFEEIYWEEPTKEEKEKINHMNKHSDTDYWIEEFKKESK